MGTAALGRPFFCAPNMFDNLNLEVKVRRPDMAAFVRTPVLPGCYHSAKEAIRPKATSAAAISNVRFTEGFRTPALCRRRWDWARGRRAKAS
jgi:hypothetical protein